jgi:hypothetical protein
MNKIVKYSLAGAAGLIVAGVIAGAVSGDSKPQQQMGPVGSVVASVAAPAHQALAPVGQAAAGLATSFSDPGTGAHAKGGTS